MPPYDLDGPPPAVNGVEQWMWDVLAPCRLISLFGVPAASVPFGWSADGLPIGVQVVGRPFREDEVLAGGTGVDGSPLPRGAGRGKRRRAVRIQRVEMHVCPMAAPNDTSKLQELVDSGTVDPGSIVALVGKTEGTGFHDDWGRVLADVALRGWAARQLGIQVSEVADRVIFVLSGGCPGVITPHMTVVTRDWEEVADALPDAPKHLVVGIAGSEPILPEDVGRMGQIRKVAEAVQAGDGGRRRRDPGTCTWRW